MPRLHSQSPTENLDYAIDHSARLPDGDDIAESVWIVPDDLTGSEESFSGQRVSIFLTGGEAGQDYQIYNQATTEGGRIVEDYIVLQVRD